MTIEERHKYKLRKGRTFCYIYCRRNKRKKI